MASTENSQGEDRRSGAEGSHQLGALIAGARKLAQEEDYETAVGQLELALDLNPASSEARDLLTSWRDTLTARPRELQIEKLLTQAESCLEKGEKGKAKATAEQILEIDPNHQSALGLLDLIFDAGEEPLDQSWESLPSPPEEELSEESVRLIEKIEGLLARPTEPDPDAATTRRSEEQNLDADREPLDEAEREPPEVADLDTVREGLQAVKQEVRELLEGARGRLAAKDYQDAVRQLDEVEKLTGESRDRGDDSREAQSLLAEAQGLYAAQRYDQVLEVLGRAKQLDSQNQEVWELRARAQGALEQRAQEPVPVVAPPAETKKRPGLMFAALAPVVALAVVLAMSLRSGEGGSAPPPPPPETKPIQVVPPSPVRPMRDRLVELPEPSEGYIIQVFATHDKAQGQKVLGKLQRAGFKTFTSPVEVDGETMYRGRVGPFADRAQAERSAAEIRARFKLDTWVTAASN